MGAQLSAPARKSGGRSSFQKARPMSDINVTPLVDVMLVLLIIFMVTAPLLTVGVPVDLPKTKAAALTEKNEPLTLSMDKDGKIFLQETEIPFEELIPKINAIMEAKPDTRIFIRGDQSISYGQIMQLMGTLNAAGYSKVALLAELPKGSPHDLKKQESKK